MLETEFIPAAEPRSGGTRRLLIALHGLGDSIAGYRWMPEVLELPWLNYLLVNAPDEYYGGYSWYDYTLEDISAGVKRSREMLFHLLDAQRAKGFLTEQTTLFGFSQGCLMAIETAARYPQLFAGVVGISGYVCQPEKLLKELSPVALRQRFLVTHGIEDPLIPYDITSRHFAMLKNAGMNIRFHAIHKAHTIAEEELELMRDFIRAGYADVAGA
jgi:phospholipase/carboxylesterase